MYICIYIYVCMILAFFLLLDPTSIIKTQVVSIIRGHLLLGYPNNKQENHGKPYDIVFSISKSIEFPYRAQLRYCQKLDFEANP